MVKWILYCSIYCSIQTLAKHQIDVEFSLNLFAIHIFVIFDVFDCTRSKVNASISVWSTIVTFAIEKVLV